VARFEIYTVTNWNLSHFEVLETGISRPAPIMLCKIDTLNQKIDTVDEKLTRKIDAVAADLKATDARLDGKIDSVASDLKAHRADTEAHHRVYQVKEG